MLGSTISAALTDVDSIEQCAEQLHAETLGLSILLDGQKRVRDVINDTLKHIDGNRIRMMNSATACSAGCPEKRGSRGMALPVSLSPVSLLLKQRRGLRSRGKTWTCSGARQLDRSYGVRTLATSTTPTWPFQNGLAIAVSSCWRTAMR